MADALLGDPFLDKERLRWTIGAVCENEGKIDVLAESAADAVDKENEIVMLRRYLHQLQGGNEDEHKVWCRVELEAKGLHLARRIMRGDTLMRPDDADSENFSWGCVILQAARFVEEVVDEEFWQRVRREAGTEAVWHVAPEVLIEVSNRDIRSFDRYLSALLNVIHCGGEKAAEAGRRIRDLCEQNRWVVDDRRVFCFFFFCLIHNLLLCIAN